MEYGYRDDGPAWQVKFEEKIVMMDGDMGYKEDLLMRMNLRKHWICMKLRVTCWIILKCGQLCMTRCAYLFIHECIIYESTSRTVDLDLESLIS